MNDIPFHLRTSFHVIVSDTEIKAVGEGRHIKYHGQQDSGKHIRFPHLLWATTQVHGDPQYGYRFFHVRNEECSCPDDEVINASEYLSIRRPTRWDGPTYGNPPSQPAPKVEWSGERLPPLTRAQRQALEEVKARESQSDQM